MVCCNHTCYFVGMVSVTPASRYVTSASCYQSRSSMYIRGLIQQNWPRRFGLNRKPVFGVSDQVMLKPVFSATENRQNTKISHEDSLNIKIVQSKTGITKALIRLFRSAFVVHMQSQIFSR